MNIKHLKEQVMKLFSERTQLMVLFQELSENFYPERADFTYRRQIGEEFADYLLTSYPIMVRRDLGNQFGSMLRPKSIEWFEMAPMEGDKIDTEGKQYLEWVAGIMRRAMYDRSSQFTRATKEGDHDFATFGQCVLSVRPNRNMDSLLYQNWHLRDSVWMENEDGEIGLYARKWKARARDLVRLFGSKVDPKISSKAEKQPFFEVECYHIVCEADFYDENSNGRPYWSIYLDVENESILEAIPMWDFEYIIPRWQTVSGSQYAYSPAAVTALPDARLIQAMTLSLLEAGEKAVNPPMVATADTVKSDVSIYAGGITWVDKEYDERLGDAIRPVTQDLRGIPFGFEMQADQREMIRSAFYLDRLSLPTNAPEMTAYEVGQRVQEYIRQATPIFEPMEMEYNGRMCELTFARMMRAGAFGNPKDNMPKSLSGKEFQFKFQSPLHDALERQKGQTFLEAQQLLAEAAKIDGSTLATIDVKKAIRDALHGIRTPAAWMRTEAEVESVEKQRQEEMAQQQQMEQMQQGSEIAKNLGQANAEAT